MPAIPPAGGWAPEPAPPGTAQDPARTAPGDALRLQQAAQRAARLGGWEVDLARGSLIWTDEACAVLDVPPGTVLPLRRAMAFVLPEWWRGLATAFKTCVRNGTAFDRDIEIVGARGWRKWVRVAGDAQRDAAGHVRSVAGALQNISERKAVEEANRRLAERLTAQIDHITDAFFTLDAGFRVTYANAMAAQMLGLARGGAPMPLIWDSPGFEPEGAIGIQLRAAAADERTVRFEALLGPTGQWLDLHAFPTIGGLTVTLYDMTERRRDQERLRLLEACVARMNDDIVVTEAGPIDEPGPRIVFVNEAFLRRTGFTREEVYGRTPRILQGPNTQRTPLDTIRAAMTAWQPVHAEMINYTKAGEEFWVEMDIQPVADGSGRITHWVAVQREVTERRNYQNRLEEQAALLDQVQDSIVVRRMDGRVTYMNASAERLLGWSADELLGHDMSALVHEDPAVLEGPLAAVLADGHWKGQLPQRRKDGTRLVVETRWTLMRHADGAPRAILVVSTDVTERLELEERLRQSQRLEAVGQLTGGVAHDFNNLLTVILGNSEILVESLGEDTELREMAEMTMSAAERGAALTSRLLAFSRRQALDPKVIDVNALLSGLGTMLRRTIGEHIDLRIMPAGDLWHALIDPPQLENAVLNLCINARDAMPAGGMLVIETRNVDLDAHYAAAEGDLVPGQYVMIAVSDTGTGMPPDVAARAFEPFFTTKEVGEGSGLGLSMVYGFMKQSGGHVSIYSHPGQGSAVKMYIPRAQTRAATMPAPPKVKEAGGWEKVLLVEDDAMVRQHVAGQLRELGYEVTVVSHAREALEVLRSIGDFDLLFTDVVMPGGMNGVSLAMEARRLRPALGVLLTSGYTENALSQYGVIDSKVRLLGKPYRRRELAEAVRWAVDQGSSPHA